MPILGLDDATGSVRSHIAPPVKGKVRGRHQANAHTTADYYFQEPEVNIAASLPHCGSRPVAGPYKWLLSWGF